MTAQIIILADRRRAREIRKFGFGAGAIIWPLAIVAAASFWLAMGFGAIQFYSTWAG